VGFYARGERSRYNKLARGEETTETKSPFKRGGWELKKHTRPQVPCWQNKSKKKKGGPSYSGMIKTTGSSSGPNKGSTD